MSESTQCTPEPGQLVVCAANRFPDGTVILGARHYDSLMREAIAARGLVPGEDEQGFIDQKGRFLTRREAWKVAQVAGQIRRRVGGDHLDGGTLYSEGLY
jgi:hypothetical protein